MAASTIPNSGGPGSSVELSAVTIAVRDKVIEKFADQPLDEMNESVKQLLSREEDEQKRLGILAARVYILRQRILRIAEGDPDRVVGSASPKSTDLVTNTAETEAPDSSPSEWTRLRILDDCEVNGVRFPKTVIIDVKADDAEKLISNGKAELVEVDPASSQEDASDMASDMAPADGIETAGDDSPADAEASVGMSEDTTLADDEETGDAADGGDTQAADSDELDTPTDTAAPEPAPEVEVDDATTPQAETDESGESVIEAPSAAEVTAALEALSTGDETNDGAAAGTVNEADAVDVEAELAALDDSPASGGDLEQDTAAVAGLGGDDAADVAAELEAAAAAMVGGSSDPEPNQEPGEDSVQEDVEDGVDKPGGWFEAQQKAEKSSPATAADNDVDDDNADEEESPKNADS